MSNAAERAEQLALISRRKATYPEVPEWPIPDQLAHNHFLAYMKTPQDVGGELDVPATYEDKEEEQWELMTYVLCEVLGMRGIWVSEERRRIGNVDVGRAVYLGIPYYARWLWSVGRVLLEKGYLSWGELTDRLAEVQGRYASGLGGRLPDAQPKSEGDGSKVKRNAHHLEAAGIGDPLIFAASPCPGRGCATPHPLHRRRTPPVHRIRRADRSDAGRPAGGQGVVGSGFQTPGPHRCADREQAGGCRLAGANRLRHAQ